MIISLSTGKIVNYKDTIRRSVLCCIRSYIQQRKSMMNKKMRKLGRIIIRKRKRRSMETKNEATDNEF